MNIAHSIEELDFSENSGLTIGNFDGVHLGHQALIRHTLDVCSGEGLTPVVMTFWPHPRQVVMPHLGHMPLTTREERFARLEALGVRHVLELPFTHELAALDAAGFVRAFLEPLRLRHLVVGYDFSLGRDRGGHVDVLRRLGADAGFCVEQLPPVVVDGTVVSSTTLRKLIDEGDVREAARLLGRFHGFSGQVVHGDGRGAGLGFPTANLARPEVVIPRAGVYATLATLATPAGSEKARPAVTCIGCKPTFGENELSVETFLLEGGGDLYGRTLRLDFVERLRGEKRFDSVDALKLQIAADVEQARRILAAFVR
ncbi:MULTISPECIES: bifunctional riboflavin kinase/FAD synthetase [Desulfovibrio]|uniref:Riboflavin biosynthesis protein n=2 Tax=Desulfovibrio TaxID=872 RepID=A0AA94L3E3_DESDE|nr:MULTISPECIES: bifunctional riboflavin kinase/FAD synthetase [Desulfovibrio]ATD82148.1 bifunctional riboflavin kinase/FAD synthetase [Desulfovibrio sp. G11]SFW71202.1 riboflavin kinase / FMN adenylyltransferase [Desulfovibrio desulfuricans]SPD34891.1 riboflavin kinase/FAD synthetase [Desulfovibrio sp. G11]